MPIINGIHELTDQLKDISPKKIIFVAPNIHKMLIQITDIVSSNANLETINLISKYTFRIDGTLNKNEYYTNEEEYGYTIEVLEGIKTKIKGLIDHAEKNPRLNENTSGYWKRFSELNNAIQLLYRHQNNNQLKLQ